LWGWSQGLCCTRPVIIRFEQNSNRIKKILVTEFNKTKKSTDNNNPTVIKDQNRFVGNGRQYWKWR
jgi:hypothetical protein